VAPNGLGKQRQKLSSTYRADPERRLSWLADALYQVPVNEHSSGHLAAECSPPPVTMHHRVTLASPVGRMRQPERPSYATPTGTSAPRPIGETHPITPSVPSLY
jgi:hypothetical protein